MRIKIIIIIIVDLDQRLERLGKSERLGLVSSRKPRRLVSVSSRPKFSMSWSRLGLGHLGLVSRLGLGVKGLVDIPAYYTQLFMDNPMALMPLFVDDLEGVISRSQK